MKKLSKIKLQDAVMLENREMKMKSCNCKRMPIIYLLFFAILGLSFTNAQHTNNIYLNNTLDKTQFKMIYLFAQKAYYQNDITIFTDTMVLIIGQNHSIYFDWNKKRNDSIDKARADIPIEKIQTMNVFKDESMLQSRLERNQEPSFIRDESKGESARIYKNRTKNEITTIDNGPSEGGNPPIQTYLQVIETIPPQEWTIFEDTMTVLGYVCQKAKTTFRGRDYTAWFTMDIPVNEGPWKLYGLPGMILDVKDTDEIFHFQAIGISKVSNEHIEIPTDRKIVPSTLSQLRDYRKNRFKKLMYGFFEDGTLNIYQGKNPIQFNELEVE